MIDNITLINQCAIQLLTADNDLAIDVIYCDPMFEKKKQHAKASKAMQELKDFAGVDKDALLLVDIAIQKALKRVVVKRAKLSRLEFPKSSYKLEGKSHIFDIYLR